jgi:hypothetical protein
MITYIEASRPGFAALRAVPAQVLTATGIGR